MASDQIPVYRPYLGESEYRAAVEALELGWLGMGSYVSEFEASLQRLTTNDERFVVAVSTGHAALHLGLLLLGCGPGDEVITPSFNNIADFQAILATGAEPVFCDVLEDTLCLDMNKVDELVSPRTKAIIAMDYACHLCDHQSVGAFAEARGIHVIHDAAHSLGSKYRGMPVGSFSEITMFSFDPVKTITTIDGGALVVQTEEQRAALHETRLIGMTQNASFLYQNKRAWSYDVRQLGFRYHLANLHAAIGLAQLDKFDEIAESRRVVFRRYARELQDLPGLIAPKANLEDIVPFMFYVRVVNRKREEFRRYLAQRGVDTGIHWQPGHQFSLFSKCKRGDLGVTEQIGTEILSLPFHSNMAESHQARVIDAVRSFFVGESRSGL